MENYTIKVPFAANEPNGKPIHLEERLTIDELIDISSPIIEKAIKQIDEAIKKSGIKKDDIDLIILAGGSSQLPKVRESIFEKYGVSPTELPNNLTLAVSSGAALYQREIFTLPKEEKTKKILGDNLSIKVNESGKIEHMILLSSREELPAKAEYELFIEEKQKVATISLCIESGNTRKELQRRELNLSESATKIIINIEVDENRLIKLTAYNPDNREQNIGIKCKSTLLTEEQIKEQQIKFNIKPPSYLPEHSNQACIGIDLGTTTSELSYCNRIGDTELQFLENSEPILDEDLGYSKYCFPSIVYFENGFETIQVANKEAIDAIGDEKCFDNFKIRDKFKPIDRIDGEYITVENLSAKLLSKIWETAQKDLPIPPSSAVITVPAAYTPDECEIIYNAAKIAGIANVTLIDEPTAVFYYYKHIMNLDTSDIRNVVVFDFGGGTTDVSIIDIQQSTISSDSKFKDCVYKILATSGDTNCGGHDIDKKLVEKIQSMFEARYKCKIPSKTMRELRNKVETAKIALSGEYNEIQ